MHEHGQEDKSGGMAYSKSHLLNNDRVLLDSCHHNTAIAYASIESTYLPLLLVLLCPLPTLLTRLPHTLPRGKSAKEV